MILILTQSDDLHTDAVIEWLARRGAPYYRFEPVEFPLNVSISLRFNDPDESMVLLAKDSSVDLRRIRSVWYRRPQPPRVQKDLTNDEQLFVRNECGRVLHGLWGLLADRFWVNPFWATKAADTKPYQLSIAKSAGLEIPRTIVTNSPDDVVSFYERASDRVVYKGLTPYPGVAEDGAGLGIYTTVVPLDDIQKKRETVTFSPCIFQDYVPKAFELRVTVIGQTLFTIRIDSQKDPETKDDWRQIPFWKVRVQPYTLDSAVEA